MSIKPTVGTSLLGLVALLAASPALANEAPGSGGFEIILLVGMMVVFYFFLIRPQQKRAKEHRQLVESLNKGDEVVTSGGILGRVTKVTDDYVVIEINTNLEIKMQKASVQATLPKGTLKSI